MNTQRVALLLIAGILAAPSRSEASEPPKFSQQIKSAADQFQPDWIVDPVQLKGNVRVRISELDSYLKRTTSSANRDAWWLYLQLEPLVDALDGGKVDAELAKAAQKVFYRSINTYPGLEIQEFRALRSELDNLLRSLRFYRNRTKLNLALAKRFSVLSDTVEKSPGMESVQAGLAANELAWWMEQLNFRAEDQSWLHARFGHPNVVILIGESMVQRALSQPVNQCAPVTDCILGTSIRGTGCLEGQVSADLLPASDMVRMRIDLHGIMKSRNVGYNKPVRLITSGTSNVYASRLVNIRESGMQFEPVCVVADLKTKIHAVEHPLRIVRRIGMRKALELKPTADRIALDHFRTEMANKFDRSTRAGSKFSSSSMFKDVGPMLLRLDIPEPTRTWASTHDAIVLTTSIGRRSQPLAASVAPPLASGFDAAIQIHESAVNHSLGSFLAGRTFTEKTLEQMTKRLSELRPDSQATPMATKQDKSLSIEFDRIRPLIFEARNDRITVGLRAKFMTAKINERLAFSVDYLPAKDAAGRTFLLRDGEMKIDFLGKQPKTLQAGKRRTIRENFGNPFPETLLDKALPVPATGPLKALQGRELRIQTITASGGWLTLTL